jgi:hypothetical protein
MVFSATSEADKLKFDRKHSRIIVYLLKYGYFFYFLFFLET